MAGFKPNKKGVVTGTARADRITWTSTKDWAKAITINAGNGNDVINFKKSKYKNKLNGQNGNDTIYGGTNIDTINGGAGNDKLYGYNGNDVIYGGDGNDQMWGGNGNDTIYGNSGTNYIYGEAGNDTLVGGTGNDFIYGGLGDDIIYGTAGNNTLFGDDGNDTIQGGANDDTIYGGTGNDVIYGVAGNNTLNGGDGNDIIFGGSGDDTIYGGTGADVIYSQAGNNTIYGEDGADSIYLAGGNETVNAGSGTNYIYISKNGGTDTIYNGGGVDTLVFSDEKNLRNTNISFVGDDLVISNKSGNVVVLKNYASGHSVKTLQFQNYSVAIDKLLPKSEIDINAWGTGRTEGTSHDDIINYNYASGSGATYNIALQGGDDTINFVGGGQRVGVSFYAGEGDLIINGFENCDDSVNNDTLYLYAKSGNLTRDFYGTTLIWGQKNGNSLDVALTNGETLRFDNYFNFSNTAKTNIYYFEDNETSPSRLLDNYIRVRQINLTADSPNFNTNTNYSIVYADGDEDHNIYINAGGNNTIVTTGNGHDYIDIGQTTPGKNSQISVNGSGSKVIVDRGISTKICVNNKDADATVYLYNNSSTLHTYAGSNTITTKNEGWNEVYIHTAADAETKATATVNTKGGDNIYTWGDVTVNMLDSLNLLDDDKMIHIMDLGLTTTIQHLHEMTHLKNDEAFIWYEYNNEVVDFEFSHYKNGQYVDVYAKDENGNRLDGVVRIDTTGGTFDAVGTDDMIHFWNYNQEDFWLSSMDRYVDMQEVASRMYEFGDAGEFTNIKPAKTNIAGTDLNDKYLDYQITGFGKTTITDMGGSDILQINETLSNIKFFLDIKSDGTLASNDLYIFNSTDMGKYFNKNAVTDYLCIKDYFTDAGKIETMRVYGGTDYQLKEAGLYNPTSQLVSDVQAWLTSHGGYDSVGAAINSGTINASAWGTLALAYGKITDANAASYWTEI